MPSIQSHRDLLESVHEIWSPVTLETAVIPTRGLKGQQEEDRSKTVPCLFYICRQGFSETEANLSWHLPRRESGTDVRALLSTLLLGTFLQCKCWKKICSLPPLLWHTWIL